MMKNRENPNSTIPEEEKVREELKYAPSESDKITFVYDNNDYCELFYSDSLDDILGEIFIHFESTFGGTCMSLLEIRLTCKTFNNFILKNVIIRDYMNMKAVHRNQSPDTKDAKRILFETGKKGMETYPHISEEIRARFRNTDSVESYLELMKELNGVREMTHHMLKYFQFRMINIYSVTELNEFIKRKHIHLEKLVIRILTMDFMEKVIDLLNSPRINFEYELEELDIEFSGLHAQNDLSYIKNLDTILKSRLFRRIRCRKIMLNHIDFRVPGYDNSSLLEFIQRSYCEELRFSSSFMGSHWPEFFNILRNQIKRVELVFLNKIDLDFLPKKNQEETLMRNFAPLFKYIKEIKIKEIFPSLIPVFHRFLNPNIRKKKKRKVITNLLYLEFLQLQNLTTEQRKQLFEVLSRVRILKIAYVRFLSRDEISDFIQFLVSEFIQFSVIKIASLDSADDGEGTSYIQGGEILRKVAKWIGVHPKFEEKVGDTLNMFGRNHKTRESSVFTYNKHCGYCGITNNELFLSKMKKLRLCSRCNRRFYCGQNCQIKDWKKEHKKSCKSKARNKKLSEEDLDYFLKEELIGDLENNLFGMLKHLVMYGSSEYVCKKCGSRTKQPDIMIDEEDGSVELSCLKCGECIEKLPGAGKI